LQTSSDAAAGQTVSATGSGRRPSWRTPVLVLAVLVALAGGAWIERLRLLQAAADLWIVSDPITKSDAAVVLGGGLETRPFAAADLYRRGLVREVLVSNVVPEPTDFLGVTANHTDLNIMVLEKLGVPAPAIDTFGKDNDSTEDEAATLRTWAARHGASSFIVPTEIFSTRRVSRTFRRALGPAARIEVMPVEPRLYHRAGWWRRKEGVVAFQEEVVKHLYYLARY
jgi:uncharacterized SAM-binding protein YcdF (DUF218 family)